MLSSLEISAFKVDSMLLSDFNASDMMPVDELEPAWLAWCEVAPACSRSERSHTLL